MPSSKWFVIINPTSGNRKAKKHWPKIEALLKAHAFDFDFTFTKNAEHNRFLVLNSVNQRINKIICVGGDGTIHNTVNGIMELDKIQRSSITLGIIPIGTGNDWVKTYHISKNIEEAIQTIKDGKYAIQDIGKIAFLDQDKPPVYFNNLAGIGFDGYVANKVSKYKHLGSIAYLIGALIGLFSFKNFQVVITVNNKKIKTKALMVLAGLCKYSGGGMRLTDYTNGNNKQLDITVAKNFSKLNILLNTPKLYNGSIVNYKKVMNLKASEMVVTIDQNKKPLIQADGEVIGSGSFKVSLISDALRFYSN